MFRVEIAHQRIMKRLGNFKRVEKLTRLVFGVVAVHFRKFAFKLGGADTVLFGKIGIGIQGVLFVHNIDQTFVAAHNGAEHRFVVVHILILLQYRHTFVFIQRNVSLLRLDLARKHLQKCGFSRAVCADNSVAVALGEFQINVFEQFFAAVLKAYARDL